MNAKGILSVIRLLAVPALAVAGATGVVVACSSSSSSGDTPPNLANLTFSTTGSVPGIDDTHCQGEADGGGVLKQPVGSCEGGTVATMDTSGTDGGDGGAAAGPSVHFGTQANDDDCKYLVKWDSTELGEKKDVYFRITVTHTTDSSPATGANPYAEVFLDSMHPAIKASRDATATEVSSGVYIVGPYAFDAPGTWTSRFHVYPACSDTIESPHGHAAFFVQVP